MRKSTSRALRISFTGMGVAALGVALAGTASADEMPGGTGSSGARDGGYGTDYTGSDAAYYNGGAYGTPGGGYPDNGRSDGPLGSADQVPGLAGVGGPGTDQLGGDQLGTGQLGGDQVGGVTELGGFQMPVGNRADGDVRELPIISLDGLGGITGDNGLFDGGGGVNTGFQTPGITGVKIPLLD